MRSFYLISIFSLLLISSCNKEENNPRNGLPAEYNVFLNLQKADGSPFNLGEVEAKGAYLNEGDELIFQGDWFQLPIDSDYSDVFGERVFGPFDLGIGWESGQEPEEDTEWVTNQLLLLRYQGISEIDTLRSRDSARYPDFRYFDIYKNDSLIKRLNNLEAPWKITIQK